MDFTKEYSDQNNTTRSTLSDQLVSPTDHPLPLSAKSPSSVSSTSRTSTRRPRPERSYTTLSHVHTRRKDRTSVASKSRGETQPIYYPPPPNSSDVSFRVKSNDKSLEGSENSAGKILPLDRLDNFRAIVGERSYAPSGAPRSAEAGYSSTVYGYHTLDAPRTNRNAGSGVVSALESSYDKLGQGLVTVRENLRYGGSRSSKSHSAGTVRAKGRVPVTGHSRVKKLAPIRSQRQNQPIASSVSDQNVSGATSTTTTNTSRSLHQVLSSPTMHDATSLHLRNATSHLPHTLRTSTQTPPAGEKRATNGASLGPATSTVVQQHKHQSGPADRNSGGDQLHHSSSGRISLNGVPSSPTVHRRIGAVVSANTGKGARTGGGFNTPGKQLNGTPAKFITNVSSQVQSLRLNDPNQSQKSDTGTAQLPPLLTNAPQMSVIERNSAQQFLNGNVASLLNTASNASVTYSTLNKMSNAVSRSPVSSRRIVKEKQAESVVGVKSQQQNSVINRQPQAMFNIPAPPVDGSEEKQAENGGLRKVPSETLQSPDQVKGASNSFNTSPAKTVGNHSLHSNKPNSIPTKPADQIVIRKSSSHTPTKTNSSRIRQPRAAQWKEPGTKGDRTVPVNNTIYLNTKTTTSSSAASATTKPSVPGLNPAATVPTLTSTRTPAITKQQPPLHHSTQPITVSQKPVETSIPRQTSSTNQKGTIVTSFSSKMNTVPDAHIGTLPGNKHQTTITSTASAVTAATTSSASSQKPQYVSQTSGDVVKSQPKAGGSKDDMSQAIGIEIPDPPTDTAPMDAGTAPMPDAGAVSSTQLKMQSKSSSSTTANAKHSSSTQPQSHQTSHNNPTSSQTNNNATLPVSPEKVLKSQSHKLTAFERSEITSYPNVYFIGPSAKKRVSASTSNNNGFDDEQGSYILVQHDHIAYRYEILKIIGKGSFGQVIKAYDHKTQTYVSIKIVRNEKRFHRQAHEEIRILTHLRKQDKDNSMNVVHLYEHFTFRNHICMTFELLSYNLYEVIKRNKFQGFSLHLVRKFALNTILCLEALHRNKIIHCDLKPENVLLKTKDKSGIKVIDFGSSCYEHQRVYTYIQSRFYRAPEVILGGRYGLSIDMWSLGCILAELYTGYPLLPGEDEGDQLATMIELLGMPPTALLEQCKRTRTFISSRGYPRYVTLVQNQDGSYSMCPGRSRRGKVRGTPGTRDWRASLNNCDDPYFIDFLKRCLEWDPAKRLTPHQALTHVWIRRKTSTTSGSQYQHSGSSVHSKQQVVTNGVAPVHNATPAGQPGPSFKGDAGAAVSTAVAAGKPQGGDAQ